MRANGKDYTLSAPMTLLAFLEQEGFNVARVVVEHNGNIITREHFAKLTLTDSDKLEIVQFVGGG